MSKNDIKKGDLVLVKHVGGRSVGIILDIERPPTNHRNYKSYGSYKVFLKGNIEKFPNIWCKFVQSPES